jgi:hypothetical protein
MISCEIFSLPCDVCHEPVLVNHRHSEAERLKQTPVLFLLSFLFFLSGGRAARHYRGAVLAARALGACAEGLLQRAGPGAGEVRGLQTEAKAAEQAFLFSFRAVF